MNARVTVLLASLLVFLPGCIQSDTGTEPESPAMEPEAPSTPTEEPPFDEEWTFQADVNNPAVIEFRPPAEMFLNFTGTLTTFLGTYLSIQIPMGCGDLASSITPTQTTAMSERPLPTIGCFVHGGTHEIHIQVNGTVEGTVHAYRAR